MGWGFEYGIHDPFSSLFAVDQSQPIRGFIFFASGFGHVMMQVLNMLGHYEGYFIIKKLQKMMIPRYPKPSSFRSCDPTGEQRPYRDLMG
jgi:hypothetical protein